MPKNLISPESIHTCDPKGEISSNGESERPIHVEDTTKNYYPTLAPTWPPWFQPRSGPSQFLTISQRRTEPKAIPSCASPTVVFGVSRVIASCEIDVARKWCWGWPAGGSLHDCVMFMRVISVRTCATCMCLQRGQFVSGEINYDRRNKKTKHGRGMAEYGRVNKKDKDEPNISACPSIEHPLQIREWLLMLGTLVNLWWSQISQVRSY